MNASGIPFAYGSDQANEEANLRMRLSVERFFCRAIAVSIGTVGLLSACGTESRYDLITGAVADAAFLQVIQSDLVEEDAQFTASCQGVQFTRVEFTDETYRCALNGAASTPCFEEGNLERVYPLAPGGYRFTIMISNGVSVGRHRSISFVVPESAPACDYPVGT